LPKFLYIEDDQGNPTLHNLDQIIVVTEIRPGHCLIRFAHGVVLALDGGAADNLLASLTSEAQLIDGSSAAGSAARMVERILERRDQPGGNSGPRVIPFDGVLATEDGSEPQS
jgi:hypothetical protein